MQLVRTITSMTRTYNTAKICPYSNQNCNITSDGLALEPNITTIMAQSKDYDELAYTWKAWHDSTGKLMRDNYKRYVPLMNQAGKENGLNDAKQMWQARYEQTNFEDKIDQLWEEVESLYDELHTYIKYRLRYIYGKWFEKEIMLGTRAMNPISRNPLDIKLINHISRQKSKHNG